LGAGHQDRKDWIKSRLQVLAQTFAVSVGAYAVLDNQLQLLLRLDPDVAKGWSNEEVARRWGRIVPPRDKGRKPLALSKQWIAEHAKDVGWVALARERLQSFSWFMKSWAEPLARLANRQDQTRGKFFEGRYKTVAILDEESLLAASVFIDLSLGMGGTGQPPEATSCTSLATRRQDVKQRSRSDSSQRRKRGKAAGSRAPGEPRASLWLCPIENRRRPRSVREGMFEGFPLSSYLRLVDFTARILRDGDAPFPRELSAILTRLGTNPASWHSRLEKLSQGRLLGRVFAASKERLREFAVTRGLEKVPNLDGCPTR